MIEPPYYKGGPDLLNLCDGGLDKESRYHYVGLADLHLGSAYTDYLSIENLIMKIHRFREFLKDRGIWAPLVFFVAGDLFDSIGMYSTQSLKQGPRPIEEQRIMFEWFDSLVNLWLFPLFKIHVVGNHENNLQGNPFIDLEKSLLWWVATCLKAGDICVLHTSDKHMRGSVAVTQTPLRQYMDYIISEKLGCKYLVTGHIHKSFSVNQVGDKEFITLPSFQFDINNWGRFITYVPTAVYIIPSKGIFFPIKSDVRTGAKDPLRYYQENIAYQEKIKAAYRERYMKREEVRVEPEA